MNDDEPLAHDLSAWEVPDPPADLADSVLARMDGTHSIDVAPALPLEHATPRRRTLVIASVAAASLALIAGVWALVRGSEKAGARSGDIVAAQAQTLSLGSVHAELDPGARVHWQRRDGALHVEQQAGAAAWRVDDGDRLVIDAGATVASVEASGASLRVEVKMNQTDARLIGASAITAAAVSLVSVIVYEGYVKVGGSHGQPTVIVQPGSTYNVVPAVPPREASVVGATARPPRPTIGDVRITPGDSATIHSDRVPVLVDADGGPGCSYTVDGTRRAGGMLILDEGEHRYTVTCDGKVQQGALVVMADPAKEPVEPVPPETTVDASGGSSYTFTVDSIPPEVEVRGGSGVLHLEKNGIDRAMPGHHIAAGDLDPGTYHLWFEGSSKRTTLVVEGDPRAPVVQLETIDWGSPVQLRGRAVFGTIFDADPSISIETTFDSSTVTQFSVKAPATASVIAFRATQPWRGEHYYVVHRPEAAPGPVDPFSDHTTCDAEALKDKGMEMINEGMHAAALAQFEASLRCKDSSYVTQLAFMESCSSRNQAKAKMYFAKLTPAQQTKFEVMCIRNSVDVRGDDTGATGDQGLVHLYSQPAAKILIDGRDTGLYTPIDGDELSLEAGKHRVTFVVGDDRYTYPVVVEAGKTATLRKDLR